MRKFLFIAGSGLVAVLAALLAVPFFVDVNDFRDEIETAVEAATGRQLTINGSLNLSLITGPKITIENIEISNPSGFPAQDFIRAEKVEAAVALLPLLSKRFDVRYFSLTRPEIHLLRNAQGISNWTLAADGEGQASTQESAQLGIDDLRIEDGRIRFDDQMSGASYELADLNAEISFSSLQGPFDIDGAFLLDGLPIALRSNLGRFDREITPLKIEIDVGERGMSFVLDGDAQLEARRFSGQLKVESEDVGADLIALNQTGPDAMQGWPVRMNASVLASDEQISLNDADLRIGSNSAQGSVILNIDSQAFKSAHVDLIDMNMRDIPGFRSDIPSGSLVFDLQKQGSGFELERFTLTIPDMLRYSFEGSFEDNMFKGPFELMVLDLQGLLPTSLSAEFAKRELDLSQSLTLHGHLKANDNNVSVSALNLSLNGSTVKGEISAPFDENAVIQADLIVDTLNIDDYLPLLMMGEKSPSSDFGLNLDLALKAGSLGYNGLNVERFQAQASVRQDMMTLSSLSARDPMGGQVNVSGVLRELMDLPRVDLQVNARQIDPGFWQQMLGRSVADLHEKLSFSGAVEGNFEDLGLDFTVFLGDLQTEVRGRLQGIQEDAPHLDMTFQAMHPNLVALLAQFEILDVEAAEVAEPVRLDFRMKGSEGNYTLSGQFGIEGGSFTVAVDQNMEDGQPYLIASLKGRGDHLTDFIRNLGFGFEPATIEEGAFDIDLAFERRGDKLTFNRLNFSLGDAKLNGQGAIDFEPNIPLVALEISVGRLDLNSFLPKIETGVEAASEQGSLFRWSEEPFSFDFLKAFDAAINIQAETIVMRAYELSQAEAQLTSSGPNFAIEDFKGMMFGGPVRLTTSLDVSNIPTLLADIELSGTSVEEATQAAAGIAPLTGIMSFQASVQGSGFNQKALMTSLNGAGQLRTENGLIRNVDIPRVNEQFGNLSTINGFLRLTGTALAGGETAYRHMEFGIRLQNGVLMTHSFSSDIDGGADVTLDAIADLPNWQAGGGGTFRLRDHPESPPVAVVFSDNLSAPVVEYQTQALQQYLGVRLGVAVFKGVVKKEGFNLGDLLLGDRPATDDEAPSTDTNGLQQDGEVTQEAEEQVEKRPEEEIRDVLIDIFTRKKRKVEPPS